MPDGENKGSVKKIPPLSFENFKPEDGRYYVYFIWNKKENKYYIGVSRNPERRINEQLKSKKKLKDDYANAASAQKSSRDFEMGILPPYRGYENAFLACISEVCT